MFLKLIENYINKLTKNDLILFVNNNNIILNNIELDYIYNVVKKNYTKLLSDDYEKVFENAKSYINKDSLKKIYNLFIDYRLKYKNYLN